MLNIDSPIKDVCLILWGLLIVATTDEASKIFSIMHIDSTISATATLRALESGLKSFVSKEAVSQHLLIGIASTIFSQVSPVPFAVIAPSIDEISIACNCDCKFA